MKDPVNIDQLFQKAADAPVHTSFDTAKESFSQSLAKRKKDGKKFPSSLKWILMITLIIGGITALTFSLSTEKHPEKESGTSVPEATAVVVAPITETAETPQKTSVHQTQLHPIPTRSEMVSLPVPYKHIAFPDERNLKSNFLFTFAEDRRMESSDVEVPKLTEDEIADNEKQKKKMMKALAKRDKDHYAYIPSGSTKYKGQPFSVQAFYMQTTEVSNWEYRTFLNDLLIQGREAEYQKAHPQEEQWSANIDGDVSDLQNLYFTHPAYDDYPVVNITREGAEMYCTWLTLETSQSKYVDDSRQLNDVRLPQRTEWVYAATGGTQTNVYPWGGPSTQNEEACYLANYKPDSTHYAKDGAFFTAKVETYNHNDFGLYNMSGNVAEMVYGSTDFSSKSDLVTIKKEAGTAGGGWMDDSETLKIEGDDPYANTTQGHPNVGFRVVLTHLSTDLR